jgi:aminoglycoside 3-N-acetyltransferase
MLTHRECVHIFRAIGLSAGDHILVHASLRKVGSIDGGADALLDALLQTVGADGTVAAPTFSGIPMDDGVFDPATTTSHTGVLTEVLRQRPDSVRSLHPTHSVTAIGPRAGEFMDGHLEADAVGIDSPCHRIAGAGGYVMLLGVTHTANSTIHVGEDCSGMLKAGRLKDPLSFRVRLPDGTVVGKVQDSSNSCSAGFNVLEFPLREKGQLRSFRMGSALSSVMKGQNLIDRTVDLIHAYPDITRCKQSGCIHCDAWREHLARE